MNRPCAIVSIPSSNHSGLSSNLFLKNLRAEARRYSENVLVLMSFFFHRHKTRNSNKPCLFAGGGVSQVGRLFNIEPTTLKRLNYAATAEHSRLCTPPPPKWPMYALIFAPNRAARQMWSPVNIAKVGLDSDGEEDRYSPPLSQATIPKKKTGEGGGNDVISGTLARPATASQNFETGVKTDDELVQGKQGNTNDSLTLPQAATPNSDTFEMEEAENIPAVPPTIPLRTQGGESEEATILR